jgi:hypothetical protein
MCFGIEVEHGKHDQCKEKQERNQLLHSRYFYAWTAISALGLMSYNFWLNLLQILD